MAVVIGIVCVGLVVALQRERRRARVAEARVQWLQRIMRRATREGHEAIETILGLPARGGNPA